MPLPSPKADVAFYKLLPFISYVPSLTPQVICRIFMICPLRVPGPFRQVLPLPLNSFRLHMDGKCLVMANISEKLETLTQQIHN